MNRASLDGGPAPDEGRRNELELETLAVFRQEVQIRRHTADTPDLLSNLVVAEAQNRVYTCTVAADEVKRRH